MAAPSLREDYDEEELLHSHRAAQQILGRTKLLLKRNLDPVDEVAEQQ